MENPFIHSTADVSNKSKIGAGTKVWNHTQIREDATIGADCIIGKNVYIDSNVTIGSKVKIQNNALIYHPSIIEDEVFIGPGVILTNDKLPRATTITGELKTEADWQVGKIAIKKGASLGAGSIILPDVTVGEYAMIGAGSVVTKDVPSFTLVVGNPAKIISKVCICGKKLFRSNQNPRKCTHP